MNLVRKILAGGIATAAFATLGALPAAAVTPSSSVTATSSTAASLPSRCLPIWRLSGGSLLLPLPWPRPCPIVILPPGPILLAGPTG